MATNASTEAIAVRYVFADQSRQSRNNYTIAMEKARALGIGADSFADFLTENGGVGNVVEAVFDFEEEDMATAKDLSEAAKNEKKSRTELVTRLLAAMAHTADSLLNYKGEVSNWVPEKPKSTSKIKEKHEPKFEKGNFVFFVTVHNPETGNYHVVQGNQFDQAYLFFQATQNHFSNWLVLLADDWAAFFVIKSGLHPQAFSQLDSLVYVSGLDALAKPSFNAIKLVVHLPLVGILTSHQTYLFRTNNNCFVRNNAHRAILQASRVKSYQFHVQYMCN
jgi:hypothetical protein